MGRRTGPGRTAAQLSVARGRRSPTRSRAAACEGVPVRVTTRRMVRPGARSAKQRGCSIPDGHVCAPAASDLRGYGALRPRAAAPSVRRLSLRLPAASLGRHHARIAETERQRLSAGSNLARTRLPKHQGARSPLTHAFCECSPPRSRCRPTPARSLLHPLAIGLSSTSRLDEGGEGAPRTVDDVADPLADGHTVGHN